MTKSEIRHPFGELLAQYRHRKTGLTQTRLAELSGYDQAILVRMCQGKKDLTGPSGRERVVRLMETLADQGALMQVDEANALLLSADMPPLFERQPHEARLIARLSRLSPGQRIRRTNLPAPLTSFVGRAHEIAEVRRLLGTTRLLTLTGSGGCGKTRLVQRIAADVLIAYSEGVWYAELAALTDPAQVPDEVVRALGLGASRETALERVLDHLRERHVLLVLDNCEHLVDAVAAFSIQVLRTCPRVTILTTSREALNVEGETPWRVPPMQPDEAERLFVERAAAARGGADLGAQTDLVGRICQRLDGMPLAIELAAARLQTMSLADVSARLDDRLGLLAGGRRDTLPRHQTLRALIDWTHDALSEPEKVVFRRLGVFVDGWTLDTAEVMLGAGTETLLSQLVRKSLVTMDDQQAETRYRYLETIRQFALEKLIEAGEMDLARQQHAEAMANLAERAEMPLRGPGQKAWLDRIVQDRANLLSALTWSFGSGGQALVGCRIVAVLKIGWTSYATAMNTKRWIGAARAAITDDMPPRLRAAIHLLSAEWNTQATHEDGLREYEQSLRLYREAGDPIGIADALFNIGARRLWRDENDAEAAQMILEAIRRADDAGDMIVAHCARLALGDERMCRRRLDEAEALLRDGIQACRNTNDLANLTRFLGTLGQLLLQRLQFREAMPWFEESIQVARLIQNPMDEMIPRSLMAEAFRYAGDKRSALDMNREVLAFARERLDDLDCLLPMLLLAKSLNDFGEQAQAISLLKELRGIYVKYHIHEARWYDGIFDILATICVELGDYARAARCWGVGDSCLASVGARRWLTNEWEYSPYIARARSALGDAAYEAALAEGRAMTVEQAVAYAFGES